MHADLRARPMRPGGRVRRTPVRALVRQTEAAAVRQERVGRPRRHAARAEHTDHGQIRIRRATGVARGRETRGRDRLRRPAPGLRLRRFVRQLVRHRHIVSGVPGRSSRRAVGVGVRVEQEETGRQVPPPTGRAVGEYEHTGRTDRQHVQAVRNGLCKTILTGFGVTRSLTRYSLP